MRIDPIELQLLHPSMPALEAPEVRSRSKAMRVKIGRQL